MLKIIGWCSLKLLQKLHKMSMSSSMKSVSTFIAYHFSVLVYDERTEEVQHLALYFSSLHIHASVVGYNYLSLAGKRLAKAAPAKPGGIKLQRRRSQEGQRGFCCSSWSQHSWRETVSRFLGCNPRIFLKSHCTCEVIHHLLLQIILSLQSRPRDLGGLKRLSKLRP